jgi:hypothetical protein
MNDQPEVAKNCMNCAHRRGVGFEFSKCMLSGHYCETERLHPPVCGQNFEGWKPRQSFLGKVVAKIKSIKLEW